MHHMFLAIHGIMDEHPDVQAIYPIHMNPVVCKAADEDLGGCDRIHIIEPLDVLDFHNFLARSYLILTDRGGILKLVGTDEDVIYQGFKELLENEEAYHAMAHASNLYGDGFACRRIADALETK